MDTQGGGEISYGSQILTDLIEMWTEGQKYEKEVIRKVIFEFATKWRLKLGMDAQGGGDFIKTPIINRFH